MESLYNSLRTAFAATAALTNNADTCMAAGQILSQYPDLTTAKNAIEAAVAPQR